MKQIVTDTGPILHLHEAGSLHLLQLIGKCFLPFAVATELMSIGHTPVEGTDVRVAITKLTDDMPSPEDTERVKRRLVAAGWPVTDPLGFLG